MAFPIASLTRWEFDREESMKMRLIDENGRLPRMGRVGDLREFGGRLNDLEMT